MKYNKWNILPGQPEATAALVEARIPPLAALVLCARGYDTPEKAEEFLDHDISLLHDPYLLKDMDAAVRRVVQALDRKELICVYGDYDVDGITATCLLATFLASVGGTVIPYVPNRMTEGYSLNQAAIKQLHEHGVKLIVTVDCGITNVAETEYARSLGIDIVITDHHECKDVLPNAAAVVNPHRPDCTYPFTGLAGVGVALKLALALVEPEQRSDLLLHYCDFAAVGTVADVMELRDENRAIVTLGLKKLNTDCRPGFAALIREAGFEHKPLNAGNISFSLAPRINASGRMGCPELAVGLLLSDSPIRAGIMAQELCNLNRDRQEVEMDIFQACQEHLNDCPEEARGAIVLSDEDWHQGVVGIVASRLAERFQAPTFMICLEQGKGKGSCRSWGQFNLFQALEACSDLLDNFGGHELAAGFNIQESNIPAFRSRMADLASKWMQEHPYDAALTVDVLLQDTSLLTLENVAALDLLEPHGVGNPSPVFALEQVTVVNLSRVGGGRHTRLQLKKDGFVFDGIFFSATPKDANLSVGCKIDIAFQPQINEFRGSRTVQFQLTDCRPCTAGQHLYQRYCSGLPLTSKEIAHLIPERRDFVAVWRFLSKSAASGMIHETPRRLSQQIADSAGTAENLSRTMVCLEVFHERGLIQMHHRQEALVIKIHKTDQKVDLESSEILIRLRRRKAD